MIQALQQRYERTAALLAEVRRIAKERSLTPEALWGELNQDYLTPKNHISVSTAVKVLRREIKPIRSELFAALQDWVKNNQSTKTTKQTD